MKKNIINRTLSHRALYLALVMYFLPTGCQQEIIQPDKTGEAIKRNSPLADLMKRVSMKDGSFDNILDRSSCISIKLPVTVLDEGRHIRIESLDSQNDQSILKEIFEKFENEEEELNLLFPLFATLPDHSDTVFYENDDYPNFVDPIV